jgi:glutathione S-transferase
VLRYVKPSLGQEQPAVDAFARHWITLRLAVFEARLGEAETGTFCHGDTPGMADACLVPHLGNARRSGTDLAPSPRVLRIEPPARPCPPSPPRRRRRSRTRSDFGSARTSRQHEIGAESF